MSNKDFFNSLANRNKDFLQDLFDLIAMNVIRYCVIGGLAVNAYIEPSR